MRPPKDILRDFPSNYHAIAAGQREGYAAGWDAARFAAYEACLRVAAELFEKYDTTPRQRGMPDPGLIRQAALLCSEAVAEVRDGTPYAELMKRAATELERFEKDCPHLGALIREMKG